MYKTMLSFGLKCQKHTESNNQKSVKTKNRRIMISSNCADYDSRKSKFIRKLEANGFLRESNSHFGRIPFLGSIL